MTKRVMVPLFVMLFLVLSTSSAQDSQFHDKVQTLYSFKPANLSESERAAKSSELDKFWDLVKGEPSIYLPLLRKELNDPGNPPFFFYDGAKLLMSISKEKEDQSLALEAISKADLNDLNRSDYLQTVHWFARSGFNTIRAGFRVLDYPDFKAFIPQHFLTLAQDYSLIFMLFPCDESSYLNPLVERLGREKNPTAQKSLALALFYTVTPSGLEALRILSNEKDVDPVIRTYVVELLTRTGEASKSLAPQEAAEIKEERRKVMFRISDEALIEFDELTQKLLSE